METHPLARFVSAIVAAAGLVGCGAPPDRPLAVDTPITRARSGSYYLEHHKRSAFLVDSMHPTLMTPLDERKPDVCPEACIVLGAKTTYAEIIRPYVLAVGNLDFGRLGTLSDLANAVSEELEEAWSSTLSIVTEAVDVRRPVRVLIKHYPARMTPGRCITVQMDVYTVADRYLDWRGTLGAGEASARIPGHIIRLRRTLQMDEPAPRLVEAWIEVLEAITIGDDTFNYKEHLRLTALPEDPERTAHFEDFAAGRRFGFVWFDESHGKGKARVSAFAYQAHTKDGRVQAHTSEIPEAWRAALLRIVGRI